MRYVEDFSDDRQKAWCIHCGSLVSSAPTNRDHVPTRSLLSKALRQRGADFDRGADDPDGYLPQVVICKECNASFSEDENYLLCVLHVVTSGTFYPNSDKHPEASTVLRSNRHVVRSLKMRPDGQLSLFENLPPFTIYPDIERLKRVIVKNARGHAYHEIGEPLMHPPIRVMISPLTSMDAAQREEFEYFGGRAALWPEVGSRMMLRLIEGQGLEGGWVEVETGRYRYAVDWTNGVTVRTIIWDYLATETTWVE